MSEDLYENQLPPMNNEFALSKQVFGTGQSFFTKMEKGSNGFYVLGSLDVSNTTGSTQVGESDIIWIEEPRIIKYDFAGDEVAKALPSIHISRFKVIPSGVLGSREFILIAGTDENYSDKTDPDRTRLMLYDDNLDLISEFGDDFFMRISDLEVLDFQQNKVSLLGIGTAWYSNESWASYPKYVNFEISKSNFQISKVSEFRLRDIDGDGDSDSRFRYDQFMDLEIVGSDIYVTGKSARPNREVEEIFVMRTQLNNLYGWEYRYHRDTNDEYFISEGQSIVLGQNVILTGFVDKPEHKGFDDPFVWNMNFQTGSSNYYTEIDQLEDPDKFYSSLRSGNKLVSCGGQSLFRSPDEFEEETVVGNGLIYISDLTTGEKIAEYSFGNATYQTVFKDVISIGSDLWVIGYERANQQESKALLMKIDGSIIN